MEESDWGWDRRMEGERSMFDGDSSIPNQPSDVFVRIHDAVLRIELAAGLEWSGGIETHGIVKVFDVLHEANHGVGSTVANEFLFS